MKVCLLCRENLADFEFSRNRSKRDGLQTYCKRCTRKYCSDNDRSKRYYQNSKEKNLHRAKERYKKNKEDINKQNNQYYAQHRKQILQKRKIHYQEHKLERNVYERERRKNDINYLLARRVRIRISKLICRSKRNGSAVRDLGCTLGELKKYIESKFKAGMTWENRKEWHIDHIIPLHSFNLEIREQFLKAVHYTNLQPLWAEENLRKSDKIL